MWVLTTKWDRAIKRTKARQQTVYIRETFRRLVACSFAFFHGDGYDCAFMIRCGKQLVKHWRAKSLAFLPRTISVEFVDSHLALAFHNRLSYKPAIPRGALRALKTPCLSFSIHVWRIDCPSSKPDSALIFHKNHPRYPIHLRRKLVSAFGLMARQDRSIVPM